MAEAAEAAAAAMVAAAAPLSMQPCIAAASSSAAAVTAPACASTCTVERSTRIRCHVLEPSTSPASKPLSPALPPAKPPPAVAAASRSAELCLAAAAACSTAPSRTTVFASPFSRSATAPGETCRRVGGGIAPFFSTIRSQNILNQVEFYL